MAGVARSTTWMCFARMPPSKTPFARGGCQPGTGKEYLGIRGLKVTRQDKLNTVSYAFGTDDAGNAHPLERLLGDFDFNAVAVGLDLADGRLTWLPEFEDFLADAELRVLSFKAPHCALVRTLKKFNEMPWLQGDRHAIATDCVAAMVAGRAVGSFWIETDRYSDLYAQLDAEGQYPRLEDWDLHTEVSGSWSWSRELPANWAMSDFTPAQQDVIERATHFGVRAKMESKLTGATHYARCHPLVSEVLQRHMLFDLAVESGRPPWILQRRADDWVRAAVAHSAEGSPGGMLLVNALAGTEAHRPLGPDLVEALRHARHGSAGDLFRSMEAARAARQVLLDWGQENRGDRAAGSHP